MKCPKCGYQSFNNLDACKKCGRDLTLEQQKLNFGNPVVVPLPVQAPEKALPPATEVSAPPDSASDVVPQPDPQPDDHILDDFFQSIDSLEHDQIPLSPPPANQPSANTMARSKTKQKNPAELPQWSQESPQGDFPFDELDSDLDALRLSQTAEPETEGNSPFDDVDTFEINWQLPMDEAEIAETTETEPTAADSAISQRQLTELEEPQREMQTAEEASAMPSEIVPAERATEAEPAERKTEKEPEAAPPVSPAIEQQTFVDEEWPLPELPDEHQTEKSFALEEPWEADQSAAESPAIQPLEVQEELPLAAREIEAPAEKANIAAIFRPELAPDPIASGVRLLTRRAQAYLADLGLLMVIFALFVCAGEVARSPAAGERFQFSGDVLLDLAAPYFLVFFALCFGYFTLFHYLSGQTPGKMLFDVRVEGDEHADITLTQAFLRCVGGLIALLPAGLGFLSIVLDEEQRGWNDRLAGCRVVMLEELDGD